MNGELERALAGASGVLFLCSGNMVRSAFAELYGRHLGCPLPVGSAATRYRNRRILGETARALHELGVPEEWTRAFRPRHVADLLDSLDESTLVLGMTHAHLGALVPRPEILARGFLLARVIGSEEEIRDPVLEGADFELTFRQVAVCVRALVAELRARGAGPGSSLRV